MARSVLLVEDDERAARALAHLLEGRGYTTRWAPDVASAKKALDQADFDAVLADLHLPDGDGMDVLRAAQERAPPPQVLLMTGRADIRGAVEAMRRGAADYLEKPLDPDDLALRLERALEEAAAHRKLALYEEKDRHETTAVMTSDALRTVFDLAGRVAATPSSSALILGESGVGKEVLAAHIHAASSRSRAPFVRVNLAALPESVVEAELFGSVRGAFTDAKRDRAGHFASAEGGTLLLDELCEFRPELQAKLLRVLEERRFFPVGSDRERQMNVRVLAATNRDPQASIANGSLRADLYYRLSAVVLRIPPLRERPEDIAPLAEHFLRRFAVEFGRPRARFTALARESLVEHTWPGNARELRNAVERALMLSDADDIGPEHLDIPVALPSSAAPPPSDTSGTWLLSDSERHHIERALAAAGGSRARAAALLGISRTTLWKRLKDYGLAQ
jgi:DNA-binding NtrC family response regulator